MTANLDRAEVVTIRPGDRVLIVFPPDVDLDIEEARTILRERFPDDVVTIVSGASHVVHVPAEQVGKHACHAADECRFDERCENWHNCAPLREETPDVQHCVSCRCDQ